MEVLASESWSCSLFLTVSLPSALVASGQSVVVQIREVPDWLCFLLGYFLLDHSHPGSLSVLFAPAQPQGRRWECVAEESPSPGTAW